MQLLPQQQQGMQSMVAKGAGWSVGPSSRPRSCDRRQFILILIALFHACWEIMGEAGGEEALSREATVATPCAPQVHLAT